MAENDKEAELTAEARLLCRSQSCSPTIADSIGKLVYVRLFIVASVNDECRWEALDFEGGAYESGGGARE